MKYAVNPLVCGVEAPPIAEVMQWIDDRGERETPPLMDLLQAVPGYPPDGRLTAFLSEAVSKRETSVYTEIEGILPLRLGLARDMADIYGGEIEHAHIAITSGCNQAFYVAVTALAKTGDEIIIPTPYYFNHKMTLDMLGIGARLLPCRESESFVPDPQAAEGLITPRTRAIALVTPNNPTGAVYPPGVIVEFFELAASRGLPLIIDETYRDFLPPGMDRPHELFHRPEWPDTLIHLYSFSKVYCITGYRVGAVASSPAFISQISKILDCLAICAPNIGQQAALFGIEHLSEWRQSKRELMQERIGRFAEALKKMDASYSIASIGAYFAYMRHPFTGRTAVEMARSLAMEKGILCLPGSTFGPDQESFLRFAFANTEAALIPDLAQRLTRER